MEKRVPKKRRIGNKTGAKGLQNGAKMEVRSPPETVPAPVSVENGPTSNLTTIYYTLAMSATPGIHRFSTHWAPNSPPKVNTERISEKVIEKEPILTQNGR